MRSKVVVGGGVARSGKYCPFIKKEWRPSGVMVSIQSAPDPCLQWIAEASRWGMALRCSPLLLEASIPSPGPQPGPLQVPVGQPSVLRLGKGRASVT